MTRPRVVQHRRTGLIAALAAVLFLLGLLGVEPRDDAWLLKVGGRPLDVRGAATVAWENVWRDCSAIRRVDAAGGELNEAETAAAVRALQAFSPPDSWSARVSRIDYRPSAGAERGGGAPGEPPRAGDEPIWFMLQAEFEKLEPVVVLVRQIGPDAQVVAEGVWSGTAMPWNPAWRVRGFLAARVPNAPADLIRCLDPLPWFAQPPRPL